MSWARKRSRRGDDRRASRTPRRAPIRGRDRGRDRCAPRDTARCFFLQARHAERDPRPASMSAMPARRQSASVPPRGASRRLVVCARIRGAALLDAAARRNARLSSSVRAGRDHVAAAARPQARSPPRRQAATQARDSPPHAFGRRGRPSPFARQLLDELVAPTHLAARSSSRPSSARWRAPEDRDGPPPTMTSSSSQHPNFHGLLASSRPAGACKARL